MICAAIKPLCSDQTSLYSISSLFSIFGDPRICFGVTHAVRLNSSVVCVGWLRVSLDKEKVGAIER